MNEIQVDKKISYISSLIFNILLQNIISTYEDYNDETEKYIDIGIEKFEKNERKKYRESIDNWITDSNISKKIKEYFLLEEDPYGLDSKRTEISNVISDSFIELEQILGIDSIELREAWKSKTFEKYINETELLKERIEICEIENVNLESKLNKLTEKINEKIEQVNELTKEINIANKKVNEANEKVNEANEKVKELELDLDSKNIENEKILASNKKLNKSLESEKETIRNLLTKKESLEGEIKVLKKDGVKNDSINKEIEYYKQLLEKSKSIRVDADKQLDSNKKIVDDLQQKIDEQSNLIYTLRNSLQNKDLDMNSMKTDLEDKDKLILELKAELSKRSNPIKQKQVIALDVAKDRYENAFNNIKELLKTLATEVRMIETEYMNRRYSIIYNLNNDIKKAKLRYVFIQELEKLIIELSDLNKKFIRNGLNYNIEEILEALAELKDDVT